MAVKKTGISRDLIFHPGETLAEVLDERGITQAELAAQTGVSPAFISNVINGKKDISAKFAFALEYALDVPKSFWMNLQANYDAELLEFNEMQTITDEEREARTALHEVVKYLRQKGKMPVGIC
ncbi:MAG: HigA family addiction module antidote protein [Clostridiales bacterium]|nr:HigA family addiction module antidote protein [Clostridiales bacterium]